MKLVQILKDGMMEDVNLKVSIKTIDTKLKKIAKSRGTCELRELYSWVYDGKNIICYGWIEGDKSNENIHKLIGEGYSKFLDQESSDIKLYGDIFIICMGNSKLVDLDILEYGEFYTNNNIYDEYDTASSGDEGEDDIYDKYVLNFKKSNKKKILMCRLKVDTTEYI